MVLPLTQNYVDIKHFTLTSFWYLKKKNIYIEPKKNGKCEDLFGLDLFKFDNCCRKYSSIWGGRKHTLRQNLTKIPRNTFSSVR